MKNPEQHLAPATNAETQTFPQPKVELHEYQLQFGTHAYHVATIDVGFGTPIGHWNFIQNEGGLRNDPDKLAQFMTIEEAIAQTEAQVRQGLNLRGATNITIAVRETSYVTASENGPKSTNGYMLIARATLSERRTTAAQDGQQD